MTRRAADRLTADAQVDHTAATAQAPIVDPMTTVVAGPATGTHPGHPEARPSDRGRTVLDIVVPVFDEERELESSVRRLHAFLTSGFPYSFRITVADNASDTNIAASTRGTTRA